MGYDDRDRVIVPPSERAEDLVSRVLRALGTSVSLVVRMLGVGLLLIGLWTAMEVVVEAWALYREPQRLAHLAVAIEQATGVDALLGSGVASSEPGTPAPRLSFMLALFFAPVLLFTAGYLAMAAVRTGGQLALARSEQGHDRH